MPRKYRVAIVMRRPTQIDGPNGFICDLTPTSLAQGIRRALEVQRLPTGATLESFRESIGKPRWERQVWKLLSDWLELE